MTRPPFARLEVIRALPEEQPILANLLELYAHDFSEFHDVHIGADGRFGYPRLPLYWSEPDRHPFLVWWDGQLAGFVLVKRGSEISGDLVIWDMAEFFVLRGHRRRGMGTQIAHDVWTRFPGLWEVRVMQSNGSANQFWARAIASFTGEAVDPVHIEKGGEVWGVYRFESKAGRGPRG